MRQAAYSLLGACLLLLSSLIFKIKLSPTEVDAFTVSFGA